MSTLNYKYVALDSAGQRRKGTMQGAGEQDAYRKVVAAGLTPVRLTLVNNAEPIFSFQKVSGSDIVDLTRELSVLVEARIPLDRGLASIAEHDGKAALTTMIRDIAAMIESGLPMTQALERYRATFGEVYIETVRAAEKSGSLVAVMSHLADLLERQQETRQQLKRAMSYPLIVMTVVALAVTVIVVFVVPKFGAIFAAHEVQMPLMTRVIQAIGDSVRGYWWAYAVALLAAGLSLFFSWKSPVGRVVMERILARTPYVGRVITAVTTGRFARVVSIGLSSGLDVIDSVEIGGRATGRPVFVSECRDMADGLRRGEQLTEVLKPTRYLPPFAKRMISAGKDSTELAKACEIVARHYDREATHLTKNVNTIVEPLLTVAMAGIVLIVALSVFLPMWQMVRLNH